MRWPNFLRVFPKSRIFWGSSRGSLSQQARKWLCSAGNARKYDLAEKCSNQNGLTFSPYAMAELCAFGAMYDTQASAEARA
jgi:hypothetical protein